MASGKRDRASMREGPLAELFRRTESKGGEPAKEEPAPPPKKEEPAKPEPPKAEPPKPVDATRGDRMRAYHDAMARRRGAESPSAARLYPIAVRALDGIVDRPSRCTSGSHQLHRDGNRQVREKGDVHAVLCRSISTRHRPLGDEVPAIGRPAPRGRRGSFLFENRCLSV